MISVHIDFISDFICPWCYIGKARLDRIREALLPEIHLVIESKPYVLYPFIPKGGLPKADFAKKTKPGMGKSLRYEAEIEGIELNYREIERIPNSLEAHRLVWLVEDHQAQYDLAKRLFNGYFEKGQNIEDQAYLIQQAQDAGIGQDIVERFVDTREGKSEIESYIDGLKEEMVNVVPSLRLARRFILPGLQSAEVWESYIRRAVRLGGWHMKSILFLEALTQIQSESPASFIGRFHPTLHDLEQWEQWYQDHHMDLIWIKETGNVGIKNQKYIKEIKQRPWED